MARSPRLLLVGGASLRLAPCAVWWNGWWWETVRSQPRELVAAALRFDVVFCEPEEALAILAECERASATPPAIIALAVRGLDGARSFASSLPPHLAELALERLMGSPRVAWLAASNEQEAVLRGAGVDAARLNRIDAFAFVYHTMLVDAPDRLTPSFAGDSHLAPDVRFDAVVVPGTGRRDPQTWLTAASLLPDVPFLSVGVPESELRSELEAIGLGWPSNVTAVPFLPLEEFMAAVRRSRVCVVCAKPGEGDAGHTTACLAQALGVPLVASAITGLSDYVNDAVSARVVPPRDARALATAVRWLWEDEKARARLVAGAAHAEAARRARSETALLDLLDRLVA